MKVLIVDDEYLIRQLIKNSISWDRLHMCIIGEAEDGEQALELSKKLKPEIIIMDINIPFINGIEVSRIILENDPNVRIIILTGYDDFKYAKEAVNIGIFNYVLKPIDEEELEKVLEKAKEDYTYINNNKSTTIDIVKKAKKYIENNYSDFKLSLEEIAEEIFVNPSYLSKIFKKELGYSVVEFLTEIRLKKAKDMIDNHKELKLMDIAQKVGYNDQYYFSKCFKKQFGVTPIKYLLDRNI